MPKDENKNELIPKLPLAKDFSDKRIKNYGDCFLYTCVKGGLTAKAHCEDCFKWGMSSGKLRSIDCYVSCNKEDLARELSQRYGTPYHGNYCFQAGGHCFSLIQNGKEIYNPYGIGWV